MVTKPNDNQSNFFLRAWRGEERLWKVFWIGFLVFIFWGAGLGYFLTGWVSNSVYNITTFCLIIYYASLVLENLENVSSKWYGGAALTFTFCLIFAGVFGLFWSI